MSKRVPLKSKNIDCQEKGCDRKATTRYIWYNGLGMEMESFLCDECCDVVDQRLYPKKPANR